MQSKSILITGGTGGIGSNLVKAFLKDGHKVLIWDKNEEGFEKLAGGISDPEKGNLFFFSVDVTDEESVKNNAQKIDKLDVLINAAAVLWPTKPFLDCEISEMKKAVEITLWGTINSCFYLVPILKKSEKGKIINFGGGGGANGRAEHMAYSLGKTGVIRFTENLALENPELDVNVIAPGSQKTQIWKDEKSEPFPEKWGSMEDLINFFRFLVSDDSSGISGKFINYKDNWNKQDFIQKAKSDQDFLTIRRVDDFQFTKIVK